MREEHVFHNSALPFILIFHSFSRHITFHRFEPIHCEAKLKKCWAHELHKIMYNEVHAINEILQFNFIGSIVSRFFCHYVRKISRVTNLFYWHKHWLWLVAFIESQRKKSSTVILLWPMNSKSVRLMDFSLFPLRLSTVRPIDWLKSIESFE